MIRRFLTATFGPTSWRRLAYVACSLPIAAAGLEIVLVVLLPATVLSVTLIGLVGMAAGLWAAGRIGAFHRVLARRLLSIEIDAPIPVGHRPGLSGWVRSRLTDPVGWRALLYLVLKLPLAAVMFVPTLLLLIEGSVLATSPVWYGPGATARPDGPNVLELGPVRFDTWPLVLLLGALGLAVVTAAPWLARVLVWPDVQLQRFLLGPSRADGLRQARAVVVDDSAARLRRIERDLHDGAQAQLVALAMKLSLAKEEITSGEVSAGYDLVDTAHADAKRALVELRDLSRGIHPPVLDQGLGPALRSLATRCTPPAELEISVSERPSAAIEAIVYYTAAELLTNAAKHGDPDSIRLVLGPSGPGRLVLSVTDGGGGGAGISEGGGLAGLVDRLAAVDGTLRITSPAGGPSTITAELPERV